MVLRPAITSLIGSAALLLFLLRLVQARAQFYAAAGIVVVVNVDALDLKQAARHSRRFLGSLLLLFLLDNP